jgi:NAD(P)-dependent dehydrogenase (short-subunit alcohol dehydrogenase family)
MEEARRPLSGQVAIVTGGGRGVGRAIAEELAAAGAAVVVAARTAEEIEAVAERIGGLAVPADVTDEADVERLFSVVEAPTMLVNNAGTWGAVGPVQDADPEVWWRDVEVSLKGTFLCTRAFLRVARVGRIVNVASRAATVPKPNASGYAAAKAAVLSFTQSVAAEGGAKTFAISPGFVRTALIERVSPMLPELAARDDDLPADLAARLVVDIATGRLDALSGSLLHVLDDVDELLAARTA